MITLSVSNNLCLEQISMVKMFKPFMFDWDT